MERRRRALGLKKLNENKEKTARSTRSNPSTSESRPSSYNKETKPVKEVRSGQSSQAGSVTPKQSKAQPPNGTPRSKNASPPVQESPDTPLNSPGYQSVFSRNFCSPEVEVSWDWSCSQVPKDMAPPPRRVKRASQAQPASPPVISTLTQCPRLCWGRQITEEENQERLAFYKRILSKSSKSEEEGDSKNIDIEKKTEPDTQIITTPKRSSFLNTDSSKKQESISSLFDDSANDFMLECSQAIEEKLKAGEIDTGPIINIKITNHKHPHSPVEELNNSHKKVCNGKTKLNLFPDTFSTSKTNIIRITDEKRRMSLRSPRTKQLQNDSHLKTDSNQNIKEGNKSNHMINNFENENNIFMKATQPIDEVVDSCDDDLFMSPTQPNQNLENYDDDDDLFMRPTQFNDKIDLKESSSNNNFVTSVNGEKINEDLKYTMKVKGEFGKTNMMSSNSTNNSDTNSSHGGFERRTANFNQRLPIITESVNRKRGIDSAQNIRRPHQNTNNAINNDSNHVKNINSNVTSDVKQNYPKPQSTGTNSRVLSTNTSLKNSNTCNNKTFNPVHSGVQNPKRPTDFTSLLDDGFDMELSSLDFDSLCCNSQLIPPPVQPVVKTPPKICSQQEIEAKRIAALNRLRMKKKV